MNLSERKNLIFRVVCSIFLLISLSTTIWALISIIRGKSEDKILALVACVLSIGFIILEAIIALKGWKKELSLCKVAFNENGNINNVFLIAVIIASVFGLVLFLISVILYCIKPYEPFTTSTLVILCISLFLLANCLSYFVFVLMYKKREINLQRFIK